MFIIIVDNVTIIVIAAVVAMIIIDIVIIAIIIIIAVLSKTYLLDNASALLARVIVRSYINFVHSRSSSPNASLSHIPSLIPT